MNLLDMIVDDKKYEYIASKKIDNRNYIMYTDNNSIYISEYKVENNNLILMPINEDEAQRIKLVINNE